MPEPAPCACPNPPMYAADCPATADLWPGVAPGSSEADPLAPFRALADQYASKAAESTRNANTAPLTIRTANQGIAAGWQSAEFLLRHTLTDLDNRRTTPGNPPTSDDTDEPPRFAWAESLAAHLKQGVVVVPITSPDGSDAELWLSNAEAKVLYAMFDDCLAEFDDAILARSAESDIDTPGCDCGHDGMGTQWHLKPCPHARPHALSVDDAHDLAQQIAANRAVDDTDLTEADIDHMMDNAEPVQIVGLPDSATDDARRALYAATLREHGMVHLGDQVPADEYDCCVGAVLAVRDQEMQQLRAELDALRAVATGYCPHCGRGDCAPTPDQYLEQARLAHNADIIVDRIRAIAVDLRNDPDARYWANLIDTALDTPETPS